MARPSSIDRLPGEVRELIGSLRRQGRTIDEILVKLRELDAPVSRSALARYTKEIDDLAEEMRRTRLVSEAVMERVGEGDEARTARINIELMHGLVMRLASSLSGGDVMIDAKDAMFLATTLDKLAKASKTHLEQVIRERQETAKKAATAATKVARSKGLSEEAIRQIETEILGIAR